MVFLITSLFQTTETPFNFMFRTEAMIHANKILNTHRILNYISYGNDIMLCENLDFLKETRNQEALRLEVRA